MRFLKVAFLLGLIPAVSYGDFAPEDIGGYSGFVIIQSGSGVYYNSGSFRYT